MLMNIFTCQLGHKYRIKDGVMQVCAHGTGWRDVEYGERVPYFVDVPITQVPPEQPVDVVFTGDYGVTNVKARQVNALRVPMLRFRFD